MRILFMTEAWYPFMGGIVWAVDNVAQMLKAQGYRVSIVADRILPQTPKEEVVNGIKVRRIWYLMPTTAFSLKPRKLLRFFGHLFGFPFVFLYAAFRLARIMQREKPDIVNVHYLGRNAFYALILRPLFRYKLVLNICGYDIDRYPDISSITRFYIRTVLRLADRVLAYTHNQLENAEAICPGILKKSGTVGQGINPEEFSSSATYAHPRPYLLTISNLLYRKGVDIAIRAFAIVNKQHPSLDLILVGEGEERPRLETLAHELGIQDMAVFFGKANRSQVGALLKGCQFLVLPSRTEAFGMVLIEAMLAGKTIVATSVGGVPEVLNNGERGLLVEPESPEALAEGICKLLEDNSLRAKLAHQVSDKVREEYSWARIAGRYLIHYQNVLPSQTASAAP